MTSPDPILRVHNLSALQSYQGKLVEMGRFCIDPACNDPDVLRIAWGAMTQYVDDNDVSLLFGCASFHGTDKTIATALPCCVTNILPKALVATREGWCVSFCPTLLGRPIWLAMRRMPP